MPCSRVYHREARSATGRYENPTKELCQLFFKTFPPGILIAMRMRVRIGFSLEDSRLRHLLSLLLAILLSQAASFAQTTTLETGAAKTIQQSESIDISPIPQIQTHELNLPSGTPIEVEAAYTVCSIDMKPGDLLSFRVLIPVIIDGATVIEKGALVTARVTLAKRGGHWGRAGKLAWKMEDVIGADNTRIPLAPETRMRDDALWSLETKGKSSESKMGQGSVTGTSHGGEVATKTIVTAAIIPFLAPLALMQGFRRGENAVLPEGKRFVVLVRADANVKTAPVNRSQ